MFPPKSIAHPVLILLICFPYDIAPNWPPGRLRLLIEDAKPALVITNTKTEIMYKALAQLDNDAVAPQLYQVCAGQDFF
jgi:hypothetical protein